jgi:hypothetical protein
MGLELETVMIDGIDCSSWTEEQRAELRALLNDSTIADQESASMLAEENAPANVIAKRRKLADFKRRELADMRAMKAAKAKHGEDDVGVVETRLGSIVMHTATPAEDDEQSDRAKAARDRGAPDEEVEFVQFEVIAKTIDHPSRERIDEIVKRYPRVRESIWEMYLTLVRCATGRALGK